MFQRFSKERIFSSEMRDISIFVKRVNCEETILIRVWTGDDIDTILFPQFVSRFSF